MVSDDPEPKTPARHVLNATPPNLPDLATIPPIKLRACSRLLHLADAQSHLTVETLKRLRKFPIPAVRVDAIFIDRRFPREAYRQRCIYQTRSQALPAIHAVRLPQDPWLRIDLGAPS